MTQAKNEQDQLSGNAPRWVAPLGSFRASDVPAAGGKGANLGELARLGLPVPAGFIVTTDAYAAVLELGQGGVPAAVLASNEGGLGEQAREAVRALPLPAELREQIVSAYRQLGAGPAAVRSSATAEDLPGAAFAGQQDTFLNVSGEDAVVEAVRNCWASLFTDRAIDYRRRQGLDPSEVRIAVVVQSLVSADVAGVLFTANPVTGVRDEVVVEAGAGLGEAVVSGRVTPEHYEVDGEGKLRRFVPGGHELQILADAAGGTRESAGTAPPRQRLLTGTVLSQLAGFGRTVAAHFGRPMDLEWALADGELFLLQARPMTALPPEPLELNFIQRKVGPFFVEMFQQRPYPLDVTGWMDNGIVTMVGRMAASVGVRFPPVSELLPEEEGVVVRLVPPVPRPTARVLAAPVSLARRMRRFNPEHWTDDPRFIAYQRRLDELAAVDLAALDWSELRRRPRLLVDAFTPITDLRIDYLPGAFLPVLKLRLMLAVLRSGGLGKELVAGARTRTSEANRRLEELARLAREDEHLALAFREPDPEALLQTVQSDPRFQTFRDRLRDFLHEFGHRETVSPLLVSEPTWSDAPAVVLGLVKVLIPELPERERPVDRTGRAVEQLLAHPWLQAKPRRRDTALGIVQAARRGMAFREDSHFYGTRVLPLLRSTYLEIGARLARAGVLTEARDVFHLRLEELEDLENLSELLPEEAVRLRHAVVARSLKRDSLRGLPLLDLGLLFGQDNPDTDGALITGSAASAGTATGRARVVRGPEEFGLLQRGEILVCPYTNPAWTPLFRRAAAVVVDAGGLGSHAAIVAREYGIPAVMGTRDGTFRLADGQLITVDGSRGRVTASDG